MGGAFPELVERRRVISEIAQDEEKLYWSVGSNGIMAVPKRGGPAEQIATAPGVPVTTRAVQGRPARTLLDAAAGADLLVVGARGRGGFTGLRLGSVSQQCLHHAPCPVVVVTTPTGS